jgi:hypothetical protein
MTFRTLAAERNHKGHKGHKGYREEYFVVIGAPHNAAPDVIACAAL